MEKNKVDDEERKKFIEKEKKEQYDEEVKQFTIGLKNRFGKGMDDQLIKLKDTPHDEAILLSYYAGAIAGVKDTFELVKKLKDRKLL